MYLCFRPGDRRVRNQDVRLTSCDAKLACGWRGPTPGNNRLDSCDRDTQVIAGKALPSAVQSVLDGEQQIQEHATDYADGMAFFLLVAS